MKLNLGLLICASAMVASAAVIDSPLPQLEPRRGGGGGHGGGSSGGGSGGRSGSGGSSGGSSGGGGRGVGSGKGGGYIGGGYYAGSVWIPSDASPGDFSPGCSQEHGHMIWAACNPTDDIGNGDPILDVQPYDGGNWCWVLPDEDKHHIGKPDKRMTCDKRDFYEKLTPDQNLACMDRGVPDHGGCGTGKGQAKGTKG